jgi:hypothetical protein
MSSVIPYDSKADVNESGMIMPVFTEVRGRLILRSWTSLYGVLGSYLDFPQYLQDGRYLAGAPGLIGPGSGRPPALFSALEIGYSADALYTSAQDTKRLRRAPELKSCPFQCCALLGPTLLYCTRPGAQQFIARRAAWLIHQTSYQ